MGLAACIIAFFGAYVATRKSLGTGIVAVLAAGYVYGIFRAHFVDTFGYFLFDLAVLGCFVGSLRELFETPKSAAGKQLRHWTALLIALPIVLFFIPVQDYMIQLVGLRGNAFLLPFLLLGATLTSEDFIDISLGLAVLNLVALVIAVAEVIFGVERFIPYSAVTDLIYASHDVGSMGAYRIPSMFVNAHSYGGQMVISIPFIIGAWSQHHRKAWHGPLLVAGLLAAVLGVFLSAARIHFVILAAVSIVFSFSTKLRPSQRAAWLAILLIAGYVISGHERLQRFKTLQDKQMVENRLQSSVNGSFFDALMEYPLGNGLGGGGTSIPYFLYDRLNAPMIIESEYARIQLEEGVFGLALWVGFLLWFFTRPKPVAQDPWFVGKRLGWAVCLMFCIVGVIGIGLLTAIPTSALMLILFGWLAAPSSSFAPAAPPPYRPLGFGAVAAPFPRPLPQARQ